MAITSTTGAIPTASTSSAAAAPANPLEGFAKVHHMRKGEHYFFYCKPEETDPPKLYQHILGLAEHEVWVWDPHFHVVDASVFAAITHPGVAIKMMVRPSNITLPAYKSGCVTAMDTHMNATIKTGCTLTIVQAKGDGFKSWLTHDRFLIVDKQKVFLMGASVGYYLNQGESTGAYEITDSVDKDLIIKAFEYYWTQLDTGTNVEHHSF